MNKKLRSNLRSFFYGIYFANGASEMFNIFFCLQYTKSPELTKM